jgi:hypothetical protein
MLTFLAIKSVNLTLNGVRGLVLASLLGPQSYGVFGTLVVLQQYSSYLALGMREGVAIRLARSGGSAQEHETIYSSALAWGCFSGVVSLLVVAAAREQYQPFAEYLWWVWLISLLGILNEILININRHEHKLGKVAGVEFIYTGGSLLLILLLWNQITVRLALQAMLLGLFFSVAAYLVTVRPVSLRSVRFASIRELLKVGALPALLSAMTIIANSIFVPLANWMRMGEQIGLVVLGNNVSMMILFGLNTVAWGLTAKSMRRHAASNQGTTQATREDLGEILLRIGVVAAVFCALCTELLFSTVMTEYAGASVYVLYFCLFQAYGLLLFSETNFLNVNSRLKFIIGGYALMLAAIVVAAALLSSFLQVVQLAVLAYFVLATAITFYCRRSGFRSGSQSQRLAALCFPVACVAGYAVIGVAGLIAICAVLLVGLVVVNWRRAMEYFAAARVAQQVDPP